ncbi:unnamed protein product [Prunus armeniaca]
MDDNGLGNFGSDPYEFANMIGDGDQPLYPSCSKYTKLSALVKIVDTSRRFASRRKYNTSSIWKEGKDSILKEGIPAKVVWYFPPIPIFKMIFQSSNTAKSLTWHADRKAIEGQMSHPANSPSWKLVDDKWSEFGNEPRNLRLALSSYGFNPHSSLSTKYNCWPVILVTYNLLPWLCMKQKFMILTLLISGPKQPGNDIDVYLEPLIDDLKSLWDGIKGVSDAHTGEYFTLKAALLWTLNDFPTYGNLFGCIVKRYKACPICGDNTPSHRAEKRAVCNSFYGMKVPEGYSSNIKNLVSLQDSRPLELKSHDCHTLMQQLLLVAIRSVVEKPARYAITRLCFFFDAICAKTVDVSKLDKLEEDVGVTLCLLEKYFPPSFFDIMVHLVVHLVREVRLCGPVYFRWMYPFETYMKVLRGYVQNRTHPEGCIAKWYIAEEAVEFCTEHLSDVSTVGVPSSQKMGLSKLLSGCIVSLIDQDSL